MVQRRKAVNLRAYPPGACIPAQREFPTLSSQVTHRVRFLLSIGIALSILAATTSPFLDACAYCVGPLQRHIAIIGICFYALTLLVSFIPACSNWVVAAIRAAVGVHAALLAYGLFVGYICPLCVAAFINIVAMAFLSFGRVEKWRLVPLLPIPLFGLVATILLVTSQWRPLLDVPSGVYPSASQSQQANFARIAIYEKQNCPFCMILRQQVMPAITREFGHRIALSYHDADGKPWVLWAPTVFIQSADGRRSKTLESGVSLASLRLAIKEVLDGGNRLEAQR